MGNTHYIIEEIADENFFLVSTSGSIVFQTISFHVNSFYHTPAKKSVTKINTLPNFCKFELHNL